MIYDWIVQYILFLVSLDSDFRAAYLFNGGINQMLSVIRIISIWDFFFFFTNACLLVID
jgi:hypothetical protein